MSTKHPSRLVGSGLALMLSVSFGASIMAHEGHRPLPTRGVEVDIETGTVVLSRQAREALGVMGVELQTREMVSQVTAYATATSPWSSKAQATARVSGKIARLLKKGGDPVRKGEVLAEIASRELEELKLAYEQARLESELSSKLLGMTAPTANSGAIPAQRLIEAENVHQQNLLALALQRIKALTLGIDPIRWEAADVQSLFYQVRSPIDGMIVHSDLVEGKYVDASEHLFDIVNNDQLWIRLDLLEKDIANIRLGAQVHLRFPELPQPDSLTVVHSISPSLDSESKAGTAWAILTEPQESKEARGQPRSYPLPGMSGTAVISTESVQQRLALPRSAIFSDGLEHYVFVEQSITKRSSEYQKKKVSIGKHRVAAENAIEPWLEIASEEVYPGDRVVVRGGHELSSLFFLGVLKLDEAARQRLGLQLAVVQRKSITDVHTFSAIVNLPPQRKQVLSSHLQGIIESISIGPGQQVKKGDLILEVASVEFQDLQLSLLQSSLNASLFRKKYERWRENSLDAVARKLLVETLARAQQWEHKEESVRQQLGSLGLSREILQSILADQKILQALPVYANEDGKVADFRASMGEAVRANVALGEIHASSGFIIEAYLPSQLTQQVRVGDRGSVSLIDAPDITIEAEVSRISPVVTEGSRLRTFWLESRTGTLPPHWLDGMLATVVMQDSNSTLALAVPNSAIVIDGIHPFVFVQKEGGIVERRRVVLGSSDNIHTAVLSGVVEGERVISSGVQQLQTAYASLR